MPARNHQETPHEEFHKDGIERAVAVIGDRWTLLIIRECFYGVRRYGDLVRNLGITRKVLSARLKYLVSIGLLERRRYRRDPDWYEYLLTDAGRGLYGPVVALLHWADLHMPAVGESVRLHHMGCDRDIHAVVVCSGCRQELDPRDVEARLPRLIPHRGEPNPA